MNTSTPVTDKDGNKRYRSDEESLANSNVTRPAPLDADRAVEDEDGNDGSVSDGRSPADKPR